MHNGTKSCGSSGLTRDVVRKAGGMYITNGYIYIYTYIYIIAIMCFLLIIDAQIFDFVYDVHILVSECIKRGKAYTKYIKISRMKTGVGGYHWTS